MLRGIAINTRFVGVHAWPDAPLGSFLRDPHRHEFHVKVEAYVDKVDREIEFHNLKTITNKLIDFLFPLKDNEAFHACGDASCEEIAEQIGTFLRKNAMPDSFNAIGGWFPTVYKVTVSEDGENEAWVKWDVKEDK